MEKTFKFRIYLNKTQEKLIQKTFGCSRFVYNLFLARRIASYRDNHETVNFNQCSKELTVFKKGFIWLKEPDKCALQNSLKDLDTAYKNFFSRSHSGFPKFKSKNNQHKSYRTNLSNNNIVVLERHIKLPKLGRIKFRDKQTIQGRILNATVSQDSDNKYYVSICCTDIEKFNFIRTNNYVGIDLGLDYFAIISNRMKYENPRWLRRSSAKIALLQKRLARKTSGSVNWEKARTKLARIQSHVANQRKDFLHKLSIHLINFYDVICLEDLQVSNMVKNHKMARSISDVSWSEFVRQLKYKASWHGKEIIQVDKFYPSSQLCHCCGYKNTTIKDPAVRKWDCPECGTHHDRDINAAINIREEGFRLLGINPELDII